MWCIRPTQAAAFVCQMEAVLDVYTRPVSDRYPVICMDETSKQCVEEVRSPLPMRPGQTRKYDVEYRRNGVAHLLLYYAPFSHWRRIEVEDNHAGTTWAQGIRRLVEEDFPEAERITVVMDNLNTHTGASLYNTFEPAHARRLLDRLEFVYTPKHGSWLNMAEIEFSVLSRQCLDRRIPNREQVHSEVQRWVLDRNAQDNRIDWRFTTEDARIKLKSLYPKIS